MLRPPAYPMRTPSLILLVASPCPALAMPFLRFGDGIKCMMVAGMTMTFAGMLCYCLRRPKLPPPPPPPNAPPKKMSQMMVIKNASYSGEFLATSSARLLPLVFDYPHIRFWQFAHNTNLRMGPVNYGKNSQIVRRNPTECMCVSARFNLTTPAEALLVDTYHFHPNLFCRQ